AALKRLPDGALMLELTVDDRRRKEAILQTLAPVMGDPALKIEIRTRDEKAAPVPSASPPANSPGEQEGIAGARISKTFPELRDSVLRRPEQAEGNQVESKVEQIALGLMGKASRAKAHALALKHTGARFSPAQLSDLDAEARQDWWIVLSRHAAACENETS